MVEDIKLEKAVAFEDGLGRIKGEVIYGRKQEERGNCCN